MKVKKVLLAASEAMPFAKTGGLADVVGALPPALNKLGVDARVIMPLHRQIKEQYRHEMKHICNFFIHMGWRTQYVGVETMEKNGVIYYFVDNEYYFGGPIYKGGEAEGEQYAFFSRAVVDCLPVIGFMPEAIHLNDWQTAMIAMLLKTRYRNTPQGAVKSVLTIHNLCYQGRFNLAFAKDVFDMGDGDSIMNIEAYGDANFLKGGLVFADKINTVSPTYAEEIKNPYFSEGMDGMLYARQRDLSGILNGIDADELNPATDGNIPYHYSERDMAGKKKNKEALIEELSLGISADMPVIAMVSRLTSQKGLDLVKCVLGDILFDDVGFVLLGSGDSEYESFFQEAAYNYCGKAAVRIGYDEALARRIYAGSDMFLMPSRFEPCGISQMIALRYGTLPIVRETGGLFDTVLPYNEYTGEGNGFTFSNYNAHDMLNVIRMAIGVYGQKAKWNRLVENAMAEDNSMESCAKEYIRLYDMMM